MSGYRGLTRELARTGRKALWLQIRTGLRHVLRSLVRSREADGVARFLTHYRADGLRLPESRERALASAAQRCLVCGRCSIECARVDGAPGLDPEEAVVSASRLEIDWRRLGNPSDVSVSPCGECRACHAVCPVAIPIADVQRHLAQLAPDLFHPDPR